MCFFRLDIDLQAASVRALNPSVGSIVNTKNLCGYENHRTAEKKMNCYVRSCLWVFTLCFAFSASAEEQKFAYVDLQRALNEVEEGAKAKAALKAEFDDKQKYLDEKQTSLKKMKDEIEARGMMMKADVKQEKLAELQKSLLEVQQTYYGMQQELTQKESEATGKIFQKMGVLLQTIGQDQGYTAILEKSSVLYAKNHLDLTNELIRRYNKAYPVKKSGKKK
jgi:outer membrane protein